MRVPALAGTFICGWWGTGGALAPTTHPPFAAIRRDTVQHLTSTVTPSLR